MSAHKSVFMPSCYEFSGGNIYLLLTDAVAEGLVPGKSHDVLAHLCLRCSGKWMNIFSEFVVNNVQNTPNLSQVRLKEFFLHKSGTTTGGK